MLNKVTLIGNLGRDPELKQTESGNTLCNISIATTETWKDQNGERQSRTEWHQCQAWGATAENIDRYLKKGSKCYVEGKLQTSTYEKEGQTHYATRIVIARCIFLDPAGNREADGGPNIPPANNEQPPF